MKKTIDLEKLINSLDSDELKELRKNFNSEVTTQLRAIESRELEELKLFINGLYLTNSWYGDDLNVISLDKWRLPIDDRRVLNQISERINSAFKDLRKLKLEVAARAKRNGTPFSQVFTTTVRRMRKYQNR